MPTTIARTAMSEALKNSTARSAQSARSRVPTMTSNGLLANPLPLPPSILFDDLDMEDLLAFTLEKRLVANLNQAL